MTQVALNGGEGQSLDRQRREAVAQVMKDVSAQAGAFERKVEATAECP